MISKEALVRIICPCRKALRLAELFSEFENETNNIFDDLAGDLEDALFVMNQEQTETLPESVTDQLIRNSNLSDEEVADTIYKLITGKYGQSVTPALEES